MSPTGFVGVATELIGRLEASGKSARLGANMLRSPDPAPERIHNLSEALGERAQELADLYLRCDGLSLPDVGGGCFLHPAAAILNGIRNGEVVRLASERSASVVVFGSDGRGGRLALRVESGEVIYLAPGVVRMGVYDSPTRPRLVAKSVADLLDRLIGDIRAAVSGDKNHSYLM